MAVSEDRISRSNAARIAFMASLPGRVAPSMRISSLFGAERNRSSALAVSLPDQPKCDRRHRAGVAAGVIVAPAGGRIRRRARMEGRMRMTGYGGLVAMGVRAAVVLLLLCVGSAAHAGKRVALVIGNSAYQHAGELANTRND